MKKNIFALSAILLGVAFTGVTHANPVDAPFAITNMSSSEKGIYRAVDNNPTSYSKKEINGRVYESWVENNTAYTKVDGTLVKAYKIDNDLERAPFVNMSSNLR